MTNTYNSRKSQYISLILIFVIIIYLFRVEWVFSDRNPLIKKSSVNVDGFVDLNVVINDSFQCYKTRVLLNRYHTTVCVHDIKKDTDVSGYIVRYGIWEENLVTNIVRILSTHRNFAFIDIGANIGIYTMYAASAGCQNIIAIECFRPNVERIRRAVQLEKRQQSVVIIERALYNVSNTYLSLRTNINNNIGSQRLNVEVVKNLDDPLVVQTIRFDDLSPLIKQRNIQEAIIKIDIETSEHYLCSTGEQIFNQINIPFVMMEWANIKQIPERANLIQQFFMNRNYTPFNAVTCTPETSQNYRTWNTQDVFWIKSEYAYLCKLS